VPVVERELERDAAGGGVGDDNEEGILGHGALRPVGPVSPTAAQASHGERTLPEPAIRFT
jgi:hypothetical protein